VSKLKELITMGALPFLIFFFSSVCLAENHLLQVAPGTYTLLRTVESQASPQKIRLDLLEAPSGMSGQTNHPTRWVGKLDYDVDTLSLGQSQKQSPHQPLNLRSSSVKEFIVLPGEKGEGEVLFFRTGAQELVLWNLKKNSYEVMSFASQWKNNHDVKTLSQWDDDSVLAVRERNQLAVVNRSGEVQAWGNPLNSNAFGDIIAAERLNAEGNLLAVVTKNSLLLMKAEGLDEGSSLSHPRFDILDRFGLLAPLNQYKDAEGRSFVSKIHQVLGVRAHEKGAWVALAAKTTAGKYPELVQFLAYFEYEKGHRISVPLLYEKNLGKKKAFNFLINLQNESTRPLSSSQISGDLLAIHSSGDLLLRAGSSYMKATVGGKLELLSDYFVGKNLSLGYLKYAESESILVDHPPYEKSWLSRSIFLNKNQNKSLNTQVYVFPNEPRGKVQWKIFLSKAWEKYLGKPLGDQFLLQDLTELSRQFSTLGYILSDLLGDEGARNKLKEAGVELKPGATRTVSAVEGKRDQTILLKSFLRAVTQPACEALLR
jgi:hypothetical protein